LEAEDGKVRAGEERAREERRKDTARRLRYPVLVQRDGDKLVFKDDPQIREGIRRPESQARPQPEGEMRRRNTMARDQRLTQSPRALRNSTQDPLEHAKGEVSFSSGSTGRVSPENARAEFESSLRMEDINSRASAPRRSS
jgi:hypothetical protein